jgi:HlyD family secretion protein
MRWWIFVLFAVIVLAVVGWWFTRRATPAENRWETRTLDRGELVLKVSAAGSIEPNATVQVGSQVSGIVKDVRVEANARVKKGQILAVLDTELLDREFKDRISVRDLAQIRISQLEVEETNLKLKEQTLDIQAARQKIDRNSLREQLDLAQRNVARFEQMKRSDAAGEIEVDARRLLQIQTASQLALKDIELRDIETERKQIASDREALGLRRKETAVSLAQAETAVEKARVNLGYATIVAPIDGVVLERLVEPGQTIAANFQTPNLFSLAANLEQLRIQAQVDEADAGRIHVDQPVTFEVDAFRGEQFKGRVLTVRLKHIARGNAISYPVIVAAENPTVDGYPFGKLRPGMTAYLTFEVDRKTALRLPAAALRFAPPEGTPVDRSAESQDPSRGGPPGPPKRSREVKKAILKPSDGPRGMKATVYLANAEGQLRAVSVRVGDCDGEFYELLGDDLKAGDQVLTGLRTNTSPPVVPKEDAKVEVSNKDE